MNRVATESSTPRVQTSPDMGREQSPNPSAAYKPDAFAYEYDALVTRLKQMQSDERAPAIVIVAPTPGAGASTVLNVLTDRMNAGLRARRAKDVTISIPASEVTRSATSIAEFIARINKRHEAALQYVFDPSLEPATRAARYHQESGVSFEECLMMARKMFRVVLVECRPLDENADVANIAFMVDAVLIVVEANKTTRSQIERLMHSIHTAGGTVMGFILNKRTFAVPASVYNFFEKVGLI